MAGKRILLLCFILSALDACIKPFDPPIGRDTAFLVVEGQVLLGQESTIRLSRSRSITDSSSGTQETGAVLIVEAENGERHSMLATGAGAYTADGSDLQAGKRYRLLITTASGKSYASAYVEAKETPQIDSLEWSQDDDIDIYVNTHDPSARSRYYRWEFIETYEQRAVYDSNIRFVNGGLVFIEPEDYTTVCYNSVPSNIIVLGNSASLSEDLIRHQQVTSVPNDNEKIGFRYSILVKQYALTADAYTYWQILQQSSQSQGDLFDPQPSLLQGNIQCTTDPEEPVIGYFSVSSTTEKGLFIKWGDLDPRTYKNNSLCSEASIPTAEAGRYLSDGRFMPAYYAGSEAALAIAPKECVDCRLKGGTTQKPLFW